MASMNSVAPAEYKDSISRVVAATTSRQSVVVEVVLRVFLFIGSLTAVVVIVTSKQTEMVPIPFPPFRVPNTTRFTDSPAIIYFVAALSTTGLYSIITTLLSILALSKPGHSKKMAFIILAIDVALLGIVAAAAGAAGGVAYVGFQGNSHTRWNKICNIYDKFCRHAAGSIIASVFTGATLILLILQSVFTMYRKIPN